MRVSSLSTYRCSERLFGCRNMYLYIRSFSSLPYSYAPAFYSRSRHIWPARHAAWFRVILCSEIWSFLFLWNFLLEYQTGQNILVNDYQILLQVRHLPATTSRSNRTRARAPNINTVSPARGHADPNTRVCVCNSSKHTRVLTNWTAKNKRNVWRFMFQLSLVDVFQDPLNPLPMKQDCHNKKHWLNVVLMWQWNGDEKINNPHMRAHTSSSPI